MASPPLPPKVFPVIRFPVDAGQVGAVVGRSPATPMAAPEFPVMIFRSIVLSAPKTLTAALARLAVIVMFSRLFAPSLRYRLTPEAPLPAMRFPRMVTFPETWLPLRETEMPIAVEFEMSLPSISRSRPENDSAIVSTILSGLFGDPVGSPDITGLGTGSFNGLAVGSGTADRELIASRDVLAAHEVFLEGLDLILALDHEFDVVTGRETDVAVTVLVRHIADLSDVFDGHEAAPAAAAADAAGKPIYLELSAINPVIILPQALSQRADALADELASGGIHLRDSTMYCQDHLATNGVMTQRHPSRQARDRWFQS